MTMYRNKPLVVEAHLFDGTATPAEALALADWCEGMFNLDSSPGNELKTYYWSISIPTTTGSLLAKPGDYILRDAQGEYSVCPGALFTATYEEV